MAMEDEDMVSDQMVMNNEHNNKLQQHGGIDDDTQQQQPVDYANDFETMKAKAFPPLDDELEVEKDFEGTWQIDDWKSLDGKVHGPGLEADGFSWRVLLFPEGNRSDSISLYLEASPMSDSKHKQVHDNSSTEQNVGDNEKKQEEAAEEEDWSVCAQFGLLMWNPNDPSVYHLSGAQHRFQPDEADWGFTKFYDLKKAFSRHLDREEALIEDNKVNITTFVRIVKDPTGVLWHNFYKYDSKKETGYVGLKNQGATCYLNSLLQSLYFTKLFRQAVYKIPTENDKPDTVPAALQRMFYLLNTSNSPVGTSQLTRSFGWDSGDAFTQHDVQELNRVLMDNLETQMKGTEADGALNRIFVGQMRSYIKCVNVDYESSRVEDYWDIQLNVKGMKTLEDSFKDYVQVEMLEGENQYQAEGYGLQDAKKGVVFKSFPPVLHLQLKRYEYDFIRDIMIKINDRYEFPLDIDLSPFLDPETADFNESWDYQLHGVLVHSGDLNVGHYYALLKPTADGHWYKFDDDRVTRATTKEVLEDNYGGDLHSNNNNNRFGRFNYKRHSSAYMLVYIRKSRLQQVLPSGCDEVPEHIPEKIRQQVLEEQQRRKEREEQQYYMNVKICSTRQFQQYEGFDIGIWDNKHNEITIPNQEFAKPDVFRVRKDTPIRDFVIELAKTYQIANPGDVRLWTMVSRQNKTYRIDTALEPNAVTTLEEEKSNSLNKTADFRLWLEDTSKDLLTGGPVPSLNAQQQQQQPQPPSSNNNSGAVADSDDQMQSTEEIESATDEGDERAVIFLKYFDPFKQVVHGVGTHVIEPQETAGDLADKIQKFMGWSNDTNIRLLEEVKPDMVDELSAKSTFNNAEIGLGDIICFEKILDPSEDSQIKGYHTAQEFYEFMRHRLFITFKKRTPASPGELESNGDHHMTDNEELAGTESDEKSTFSLWLSWNDTYDTMANKVADILQVDPGYLQFFSTSINRAQKTPIKSGSHTIKQMLASPYVQQYSNVVLYEVLEMSLSELQTKKTVSISWLTDGLSQEHKYDILVPKTATMRDVLAILKVKANISDDDIERAKMWSAQGGKIHRILNESFPVGSLTEATNVYATVTPQEEIDYLNAEGTVEDRKFVFVVHFQKDPTKAHSIPFSFLAKKGELFSDTKHRVQKILGIYDKVFENIKFAIIKTEGYGAPKYIEDDDFELFSGIEEDESLGMDHFDKTVRRNNHYGQGAIFIKN